MAKHSKPSSKNSKKVIAIASLSVILVVALGIIAYQVFILIKLLISQPLCANKLDKSK
ncbi:hypothetical protein OBG91_12380 [Lactococcus lactis]|nr:hypothetical protein [Lactococcus lactis]